MKFLVVVPLIILSLSGCTSSNSVQTNPSTNPSNGPVVSTVSFTQVRQIVDSKCISCHSGARASGGISYENDSEIVARAGQIKSEVVVQKTMPPANSPMQMTEEERTLIGAWVDQGAKLN